MNAITSQRDAVVTTGLAQPRRVTALTGLLFALSLSLGGCDSKPSTVALAHTPAMPMAEAGDPSLAVDPATKDVLMSWVAGDSTGYRIWFARSSDRGDTWSTPIAVTPTGEHLRIHPESSPTLVCEAAGKVGVAYSTSVEIEGRKWPASDLRFVRSLDGGRTWAAPTTVNDDTAKGPGNHSFHGLTQGPKGRLVASWLDSRPGGDGIVSDEAEGHDASIHIARSDDFGATWSENLAQWSRVCPCCRTSIAVDLNGGTYVAFRKHFPGQVRDAVVARTDTPPVRMHADDWVQGGCPHSGPPLLMSLDGTLRMAWFTGAEGHVGVYFREVLAEHLDSLGTPVPVLVSEKLSTVHVSLAEAGMSGTLVACDADTTGAHRVTLARVEASGHRVVESLVVPYSSGASHPRLAVTPDSRLAYVAWTTHERDHEVLRLARWQVGR